MEKNTLLAIVLSIVVLIGFYFVQFTFFPQTRQSAQAVRTEQMREAPPPLTTGAPVPVPADGSLPANTGASDAAQQAAAQQTAAQQAAAETTAQTASLAAEFPQTEELIIVETPLIAVTLSNRGGDIESFKLKEHAAGGGSEGLEMILTGSESDRAFSLAFGDKNAAPVDAFFAVTRVSEHIIEFYRDFMTPGGAASVFRLIKRYTFYPNEYMFQLDITVDGAAAGIEPNFNGCTYTLAFGPQIGPAFEALDERSEYRHYIAYINGKRKQQKVNDTTDARISAHASWAAIAGKYFTFFALPDETAYELVFSQRPRAEGIPSTSRLYIERPPVKATRTTDTFKFYLGPKTQKALARYDNADNAWGLRDTRLESLANASGFWGVLSPLESVLKWMLSIFYRLAPNYGVAIILVTLVVKLILFPLTKKSSEGTLRMQALAPKMKELQEKYKDNPQKLNAELAAFYKREKYNPMAGCLPLLIQFPIFIAMYNLFNNHFDLRNALFIPGWIDDLSRPESILHFNWTIPFLGWSDLRVLPFIYVGSQLVYSKLTQTPDTAVNQQMKMMMYLMPIMFFFILYNVPSGLLVYWIASNILAMAQQLAINKYLKSKRAEMGMTGGSSPAKKVTPPSRKRRRRGGSRG
ncbi:MAG: membrane protein insertase YidC [Spirochaetaceae bacterium]|jgi:YidC/Oxa1 family membrane protein insertase|nr:membrane protein insertase YidC [Spirochaetaceae bacterium]